MGLPTGMPDAHFCLPVFKKTNATLPIAHVYQTGPLLEYVLSNWPLKNPMIPDPSPFWAVQADLNQIKPIFNR